MTILCILAEEEMTIRILNNKVQDSVTKLMKNPERKCKDTDLLRLLSVMTESDMIKRKRISEIKED
jgi:hypothetical protein